MTEEFMAQVNAFMLAQNRINAANQRSIDAQHQTIALLTERVKRLEEGR